MKTFSFSILLIAMLFNICSAQSGWYRANDSIPGYNVSDIKFTSASTGYAICYNSSLVRTKLLKTTNGGTNWVYICAFDNLCSIDISFINDLTGYSVFGNAYNCYIKVCRTTNGGTAWYEVDSMRGATIYGPNSQSHLEFLDANTGIVRSELSYCYRTTNGGQNWLQIPDGGTFMDNTYDIVYLTSSRIVMRCAFKTKVSEDGGLTWNTGGMTDNLLDYTTWGMSFVNSTTGYLTCSATATTSAYVKRTTDGGHNWFNVFQCDYNNSGCSLSQRMFFANEMTGYTASLAYGRIYKTTNGGSNWTRQYQDSARTILCMHFIDANTGFCGTNNGVILKTSTGGTPVRNISEVIPDMYVLRQNYPNPFNPETKIVYSITNTSDVSLKVFDATGKEVSTIVNERQPPGTYEAVFNASALSSGVYYYRLTAEGFSETRKMVLIK